MGNGPGGLVDYIDLFRSEPLVQGGLVWEWANHGLLKKEGDLEYYAYGGDFGDEPNDADFIMDGLLLSDHTPMPSLAEYAKVIQPVTVKLNEGGDKMVVVNHYDFLDLGRLDATWHLVQDSDGNGTESKSLELPGVPAGENRTVDLPFDKGSLTQDAWLTVEFKLKQGTKWADEGHVVAWDQLYFQASSQRRARASTSVEKLLVNRQGGAEPERNGTKLQVDIGSSQFGFDLLQGNVTWSVDGVDLLQRGPELSFCRALTQNDMGGGGDGDPWAQARVCEMHTQVRDVTWESSGDGLAVMYHVWFAPKVLEWGADAILTYTVSESSLRVRAKGEFVGESQPEVLPRIGLMAVLPKSFDKAAWFGRGPGESYRDSKQAGRVGRHESTVEDLFQYYDYPQENGNREDARWLRLTSGPVTLDARRGEGAGSTFSFTAKRYMPGDLDAALHPHELTPLDFTVLNLDYETNGLGTASCGPGPFEEYRCFTKAFDFSFDLSV